MRDAVAATATAHKSTAQNGPSATIAGYPLPWIPQENLPTRHNSASADPSPWLGTAPRNGSVGGPQLRKSSGTELRKSGGTHRRKSGGSDQRKSCTLASGVGEFVLDMWSLNDSAQELFKPCGLATYRFLLRKQLP